MQYDFDWDPEKNRAHIQKHGISFRLAASAFRDLNQMTLFDDAHSQTEDRWITLGIDGTGILRVVVHTFEQTAEDTWKIRMIPARKANQDEENQYNLTNQ